MVVGSGHGPDGHRAHRQRRTGTHDAANQQRPGGAPPPLALAEFEPKSMLHVQETHVARARFPVIDFHTHVSPRPGSQRPAVPPRELLRAMDAVNVQAMVNLTGGSGEELRTTIETFDRAFPRRFVTMTEPTWARASEAGYASWQAEEIAKAKAAGAVGVKVLKTLGLYLRDGGPRAASCGWTMPGSIRCGTPVDAWGCRSPCTWAIRRHSSCRSIGTTSDTRSSALIRTGLFYGKDFPAFKDILHARDRVFARHPKTTFVALHVGHWAENLRAVGEMLDSFPNVHVETGARIGELGRQPRTASRFFDKYQDRVMFGTDAIPLGRETPQQVFGEDLYRIYYRFLETEDEHFDYAPSRVPPQGRWRIYGLGLPDQILRKVYHQNAERVLGMKLVGV